MKPENASRPAKLNVRDMAQPMLRWPSRIFLLIMGPVSVVTFFSAGFEWAISFPQDLFTIVFPAGCIFFGSTFVEIKQDRIAHVFRVGRLIRWEWQAAKFDNIADARLRTFDKGSRTNLWFTLLNGGRPSFTIPSDCAMEEQFRHINNVFGNGKCERW